jgi:HD-GYP domain-containing protein (c-di-GMP phosphodiesterase class II)
MLLLRPHSIDCRPVLQRNHRNQDNVLGRAVKSRNIPAELDYDNGRILFMMAAALGERDTYTHAHALRVAAYTKRLAQRLEMKDGEVHQLALGGMLHDLGKLALSDHIFSNKQAALSQEMLGEVYSHPLIGAALLRNFGCGGIIAEIVLYHHERIDGSGYPFGIKGKEIPLSARLVSVADCFDAITTDRPYQRRKSREHAFAILGQMAGTSLPRDLVALMIKEVRSNGMEPVMPAADADTSLAGWILSH